MELNSKPLDKWEIELQNRERELKACQNKMGLRSCLSCSKLLNCNIRETFVHAVYSSMNKGAGGGFEF